MTLFMADGVRAVKMDDVKMDDIAAHLGISKRTLYELYSNKEQLLLEGFRFYDDENEREMMAYVKSRKVNEIEVMVKYITKQLEALKGVNPLFFSESHRYQAILDYLRRQHENRRQRLIDFIMTGVRHGYFKAGLNYDIVEEMCDAIMNHVMESRLYEKYPMEEIFRNYLNVILWGYCTEKGIRELNKLIEL